MLYENFLSPQVTLCAIITYEHGTYELPHELRLGTLENYKISRECLNTT